MKDLERYLETMVNTAPMKLAAIDDLRSLEASHAYLVDLLWTGELPTVHRDNCAVRIDLLRREIELRRLSAQSDQQHQASLKVGQESLRVSKKTLRWAKMAVAAAIVIPIVIALISDSRISKFLPSTSSHASPTSGPTAAATAEPTEIPTATESASTATATAQPTETPKETESASPASSPTSTPE